MTATVTVALADGTAREAVRAWSGAWECPWCLYPFTGASCGNPACDALLGVAALAARRADREASEAAGQAAARRAESLARSRRERECAEAAERAAAVAAAEDAGQCTACLRRSLRRGGRRVLVRHRDPANCPSAGW